MDSDPHAAVPRGARVPVTASTVNARSVTSDTIIVTNQLTVATGASIQTPALIVASTRIDSIWLAALAQNMGTITSFISSGDIPILLRDMAAAQGAIAALQATLAATTAALATAQATISTQGAALSAAQASITSLSSTVGAVQTAAASLAARVTNVEELQTEDGARLTDVENVATALSTEVGEIETYLGSLSTESDAGTASALIVGGTAVFPPSSFVGRDVKMYGTGTVLGYGADDMPDDTTA